MYSVLETSVHSITVTVSGPLNWQKTPPNLKPTTRQKRVI